MGVARLSSRKFYWLLLGRIIDRMIQRAIERRYQSTQQILKDLNPNFQIVNNTVPSDRSQSNPEIEQKDCNDLVLVSTTGINYTELADLLKNHQWYRANQETAKLLLQAGNKKRKNWLERDDIYYLACEDLQFIDRLWREYSQDNFGFSIQAHIWQNMERQNYKDFGTKVGWMVNKRWILLKELNFNVSAPTGHLPAISWWDGHAIWGLKTLFSRINTCYLNCNNSRLGEYTEPS